jgi:hypothetical protein
VFTRGHVDRSKETIGEANRNPATGKPRHPTGIEGVGQDSPAPGWALYLYRDPLRAIFENLTVTRRD